MNPKFKNNKNKNRINNFIRSSSVIVIMPDGTGLKQMAINDAISFAESLELDLVEISQDKNTGLPLCKVIDYGKYLYQKSKAEKENRQKNKVKEVKTIQFGLMIDDNDKDRLLKKAREVLEEDPTVNITIRFKNRLESNNKEYLKIVVDSILLNLIDIAEIMPGTKPAKKFKNYSFVLSRKKN